MGIERKITTGRRILAAVIGVLILIACCGLSTAEVRAADGSPESSVEFVKNVVKAVNTRTDTPDMFYQGDRTFYDLKTTPMSRTFFALASFQAKEVEGYPELVDYSCKIPGVVTASYCTVYDACFIKLPKYSKWVEVQGTLRVLTLSDGTRMIDISSLDNPFAAYACFKYINPFYFEQRNIDISQGYNKDNRNQALILLASIAADPYANMTGYSTTQEYLDAVVNPELLSASDNLDKWSDNRNQEGFNQTSILMKVCLSIMAVPILYALYRLVTTGSRKKKLALEKDSNKTGRIDAIHSLDYSKYRKELTDIALTDRVDTIRTAAMSKLKYPQDRDAIREIAKHDSYRYVREKAIKRLSYPEDKDVFIYLVENNEIGQFEAFKRLQYPEDRAVFVKAAQKSSNPNLRREAVEKLVTADKVKEEAKALDYVVRNDEYHLARRDAVNNLSYPKHRDTLRFAAENDNNALVVEAAVAKLSASSDKDIIVKACKDSNYEVRSVAIEKVDYKDARNILRNAAENDGDSRIRLIALKKLSPDRDLEVIKRILEKDYSAECRQTALGMLSYDKAHDTIVHTALHDEKAENRHIAIKKLRYPQDKEALAAAASHDEDSGNRAEASRRLPFTENRDAVVRDGLDVGSFNELGGASLEMAEKAAIMLALQPENTKRIKQFLCRNIQRGLNEADSGKHTTLAGWSAAALGRVLALSFKPNNLEDNYKRIQPAFDEYNELITHVQGLYAEFNECRDDFAAYKKARAVLYGDGGAFSAITRESRLRQISDSIDNVHSELAPGPGNFMIDNGDEPMAYLVHILRDNQSRVPRFIKQGVIMGLVDWLVANKSQPQAADLLNTVLEVRKDMITTDNKLSFFEVRVPEGCIRHDYEKLLADVLHCANPGVKYADMSELMDVAETEVPGCMDMLTVCPLRIIDPANQTDLGFYTFEPFIHKLWYQYEPPKGTGQVKARFHEVDDRTRPLSSGLNLRLFTDPYSVIPTLFHEHKHFVGDVNEASVFLKTQLFSIDFYKKYKGAKPARDVVFATLTDLLGMPPSVDKCDDLNALIKKYYGEQTTEEEAEMRANGQISMMNMNIVAQNSHEKWCPDIKYPLLTDEEDKKTKTIIHDSIVKYCTAPKHLTEQQFTDIVNGEYTMVLPLE